MLFAILLKHVSGDAKNTVQTCLYEQEGNRFLSAMTKLENKFGNKLAVINAHEQKLLSGDLIKDTSKEFSNLINEVTCFESVYKYYHPESSPFADDIVAG